ncbi:MAG: SurA N-terminal domain-containing protein [Burkholderiales bacterium]|jgi:peptidyl-prolyl cis-trans isomerase D|nr:SurA N-terminal domain-containing protein [Burkholderiales bacterium]
MYDFIKHNKLAAQIVMVIIIIPFLFFGIDMFRSGGVASSDIVKVGDISVSVKEFDSILENQKLQARSRLGDAYDPAMFDTPERRYALLDRVVNEKVLEKKARDERFHVSDVQLSQAISGIGSFQENGQFSYDLYRNLLQKEGMTPSMFDAVMRQTRLQMPLVEPLEDGEIIARETAERYYRLAGEKREITIADLNTSSYIAKVSISDEDVRAYYDENSSLYQSPETVSLDYVLLTRENVARNIEITEEEARESFEQTKKRYLKPETREAAHILISIEEAGKGKAREKAEEIFNKVKAAPDKFAEFAKEFSQDIGSAQQGGELGAVTLGIFVKPFEEAVYNAQESGILDPVESEYGYHIIKVTIVPPYQPEFDEVKTQVMEDMRQDRVNREFADKSAQMADMVFDQSDSFESVSQELGVPVSHAEFLTRTQVAQLANGNQRFVEEVFSPELLKGKQNTEALDVGRDSWISARVIDHKPMALRPFEEVSAEIRRMLLQKAAFEMVVKDGEEKLAQLKEKKTAKELGLTFSDTIELNRQGRNPNVTPGAQTEIFRTLEKDLPAYIGASLGNNRYVIYRVGKIIAAEEPSLEEVKSAQSLIRQVKGQEIFNAYLLDLRDRSDVKIYQDKLNTASN